MGVDVGQFPAPILHLDGVAVVEEIEARTAEHQEVLGTWTLDRDCFWGLHRDETERRSVPDVPFHCASEA
jgi:hypothetical protein